MHKTKKESQCEKCKLQYMDLNSFYINLDQHNNGEVCFDLQDSVSRDFRDGNINYFLVSNI